jgi:small-conductance mechanosensitive channel
VISKNSQPLIPVERLDEFLQIEPALVILGLACASWIIYKLFLRSVSRQRHDNLQKLFVNLMLHVLFGSILYSSYFLMRFAPDSNEIVQRLSPYVGFFTLCSGATVVVKTARILVFEYLFLGHMREGVPVLLVNLFTLLLSIVLGGWILTEVFAVKLTPLLATSAIFSLVLGLAVQDTLGNLFAGVALQLDKPYEIGDWIEVQNGMQKVVGQVNEISWRATVLLGLSDEAITLPNRVMGQAQVSNFSTGARAVVRSQTFRIPIGSDDGKVRSALLDAAIQVQPIRRAPEPLVLLSEVTDSWSLYKLVYTIDDYGKQWTVADQVIHHALDRLDRAGVGIAAQRIEVVRS